MRITPEVIQRFIAHISDSDKCLEWSGALDIYGYGALTIERKVYKAHRFIYELLFGKLPSNISVCHRCDNPKCVNPNHLWAGTHAENMKDMVSKGRLTKNRAIGERSGQSKITEKDVLEIRRIFRPYSRKFGAPALGKRFGIAPTQVKNIIHRRNWKHI